MNAGRQRRVLFREFLFRIVDRELLSSSSTGDASRLLLQILTLLLCAGTLFSIPALFGGVASPPARQLFGSSMVHFLVATTMLTVGVFAVLGWNAIFPDRRDILVLAPLPVGARTILFAKLGAVGAALAATVVALHAVAGIAWPLMLSGGAPAALPRLLAAYWLTMIGAGLFVFGVAAGLHGVAAALLPHRVFLRASSILQLSVFCVVVGGYFLQPMAITPAILAQRAATWASSPTYWFVGLFHALAGWPVPAPLAQRAVVVLTAAVVLALLACVLSYVRTLRRLTEEPDIMPAIHAVRRLPPVGSPLHSAIGHFSARTLVRSAAHRVIFTFYLGIGFALSTVLLKTPRARAVQVPLESWADMSTPLIVSSVIMMACAVVGARLTFAMPRDLAANWIFRILPLPSGRPLVSARRRAYVMLAAAPISIVSAVIFLTRWPWVPAVQHLVLLALFGAALVEVCLWGTPRIPFTCSYLPGRSHAHVTLPLAIVMLLVLSLVGADVERRAFDDPASYATLAGLLTAAWICCRWWTEHSQVHARPMFEDEPADRLVSVQLWDVR
jgi:hypothetical protein